MTKEELLAKRAEIQDKIWDLEQKLKNKVYVSSVDFASMYPSIIRLLNASIESLVGFLDDDPIAYRMLSLTEPVVQAKVKSKELVKGILSDSRYVKFVGKKEERVSLRKEIYEGKYQTVPIEGMTETPFERYFLALMDIFDADKVMLKFQGEMYSADELQEYFKEMDYSVSGSGAVFKRSIGKKGELGLIPTYLEYLFYERKKVKKEMAVHYKNKILLQKFKMAAQKDGLYS